MSSVGAGSNASDVGLIVQGTLIFLSAVVGVCGYIVQARSKQKQYLRETQILHLRQVLNDIIGPAQSLGSTAKTLRAEFYNAVAYKGRGMTYREQVDDIFGEGALRLIIDGEMNEYRRFVSPRTEAEMSAEPHGFVAVQYRKFIRIFVKEYHRPLANLLKLKHCSLPLPSREEFKRRFPGHKRGTLRKTFWLWQCGWTAEMEAIISDEWDKGIFTTWFPVMCPFPTHITSLNTGILNDVKNEIERLTRGGIKMKDKTTMQQQTQMNLKALAKEKAELAKRTKNREKEKQETQGTKVGSSAVVAVDVTTSKYANAANVKTNDVAYN